MFTGEYLGTLDEAELDRLFDLLQEEHDVFMSGEADIDMEFMDEMDDLDT